MKRDAEQKNTLDGPGSQPDYSGPMPAEIAAELRARGEEIRIAVATDEVPTAGAESVDGDA